MRDAPRNALADGFAFNEMALTGLLEGFKEEDYSKCFHGAKCAHWYIGHHALCRRHLADMVGREGEVPPRWEEFFGINSTGEKTDDWPTVQELLDDAEKTGEQLIEALAAMTPEDFAAPAKTIPSGEDGTVAHRLGFMYWHEGFHFGQIAMIRAMLGLPYIA